MWLLYISHDWWTIVPTLQSSIGVRKSSTYEAAIGRVDAGWDTASTKSVLPHWMREGATRLKICHTNSWNRVAICFWVWCQTDRLTALRGLSCATTACADRQSHREAIDMCRYNWGGSGGKGRRWVLRSEVFGRLPPGGLRMGTLETATISANTPKILACRF
jgi:hypothetical protein